ncbi:response regulator [Cupriavidus sp. AU9028]|uniref:hybrid sensor histidine kinase/response regulator n=1 Tax=Cupriavidus sp. AU9028 TaxID=2871157 RepID=UPI001C95FFD4|nr:response regulator [Cupriavidus sp. AU9028]MBY4896147.1 response regulator [Cupriavidus sp. AU9028]
MARRIRDFDWSRTELGPIDQWQRSLAGTVQLILASPVPMVLLWGKLGYMIYNDPYAGFAGGRHPYLLGSPVERGWPEVAEFNRHVMDVCLGGGTLTYREKELVLLRNGKPEDVWMDLYYSPVADDHGRPAGVLAVVIETTERVRIERSREQAEAALQRTNERLQLALNTGAVLGTWVWDVSTDLVRGDERFARTFAVGVAEAEAGVPRTLVSRSIHPDDYADLEQLTGEAVATGKPFRAEYRIRRPGGDYMWVQANGQCQFGAQGEPLRFPGVLIDIHERKIAEQALLQLTETLERRVAEAVSAQAMAEGQLRQAQKMEAIGSLTGGIAHDFNNVLQVISGNLQMLASEVAGNPMAQGRIATASTAVRRGAKLAAHLLAFARRQPLSPAPVDPARLVSGMTELLHRTLGEAIDVETKMPGGLWNVLADRNQLENALLNLAINARDAMPGGGKLTIAASNVVVDNNVSEHPGVTPGEYVFFTVRDTGVGMSSHVLEHAFEPFFTTKPDGHGTGLGLSMVFGFVKQSGGHTAIHSAEGAGTTVCLYFPRCEDEEPVEAPEPDHLPLGGHETVLVVEDDADVRITAVEMLAQLGYRVRVASDGEAALRVIESGDPIDLLFTDVIMPGQLKGGELARRVGELRPGLPVLFTSGYTRDEIFHHGKLDEGVNLLSKPYRRDDLARAVRSVLNAVRNEQIRRNIEGGGRSSSPARDPDAPPSVLLVEDDVSSQEALRELLMAFGLRCSAAGSAEEALQLAALYYHDVLLTDLTLPGIPGDQLAMQLRDVQPELAVVIMSGYGADPEIMTRIPGLRWLAKPIDLITLQESLAEWIGNAAPA